MSYRGLSRRLTAATDDLYARVLRHFQLLGAARILAHFPYRHSGEVASLRPSHPGGGVVHADRGSLDGLCRTFNGGIVSSKPIYMNSPVDDDG